MRMNRRQFTMGAAALLAGSGFSLPARADETVKVKFATDWLPQGAHGGYYQAVADGTFQKLGLEVEIIAGGPSIDTRPLLASGEVDFLMLGNLLLPFDDVKKGLPLKVVAAHYQKDPMMLMAHKGIYKDFADLTRAEKLVLSKDGELTYGKWMFKSKGFHQDKVVTYDYSLEPFFGDTQMVQQGYAVSEPYAALSANVEIDSWLLADEGWNTYGCMIQTRDETIVQRPDVVQKFVDGCAIGWYTYLYGDPTLGIEAIVAANPEQSASRLEWENEALRNLGIVDSGESETMGIGAMSESRIKAFHDLCIDAGLIEAGSIDLSAVADFTYTNKSVGIELRKA